MEATAVVEAASDKGCCRSGDTLQKDESSYSKKGKLLISSGCQEVKFSVCDDAWDSTSKQRPTARETSDVGLSDVLAPCDLVSEVTNTESTLFPSSEFEDSTDHAFLNEIYSNHYSDSRPRNESHIHLNSESKPEMQKQEEVFFDDLEHQGSKTNDLEEIDSVSDDGYKETTEDIKNPDMDEDSQQEYHSAEEQESLSSLFSFDQTEALSASNLEVVGLRNSEFVASHTSNLEDNHVQLGRNSINSLDSVDVCGREDTSRFQTSLTVREYRDVKHEHRKEQGTSLLYPTVFDEMMRSSSFLEKLEAQSKSGFLNPSKTIETKTHIDKMKYPVPESKNVCGNAVGEKKMVHVGNAGGPLPGKAFEPSLQSSKGCHSSWTAVIDDSIISACGYSPYKVTQNNPDLTLEFSSIAVRNNSAVCSPSSEPSFHGREESRSKSAEGTARALLVSQTVDVSTDFRACFTTSRATSAVPSMVSTSSNTEITMMNKKRPGEWPSEKPRSVACNTDWSFSQDCVAAQAVMKKGPGKAPSTDSLRPSGHFLNKDSLKLRKKLDITILKKHFEREAQLSEETEESFPSLCCQKLMRRALQVELHLLTLHYRMCHRHCSDLYRLVMENKEGASRNLSSNSTKKELGSVLLSVLGDLKARYVSLREKINKGMLLEELPPLSVESKLLSTFSAFVSMLMNEEKHTFSEVSSELDNPTVHGDDDDDDDDHDSSSLKKTLSQVSLLSDICHPKQNASSKNNSDINEDLSQQRIDEKDCRNCQDISEDWFDAKENLTGVDTSGIKENQIEQDRTLKPEMKSTRTEPLRRDKAYVVHIGGLGPLVSEADLRSLFQKYEISEISIYDSSTNYRCASLAFKESCDAKMAAKEMSGMQASGEPVRVRLVRTSAECRPLLSPKNGNRLRLKTTEDTHRATTSCASRLPSARPRQLGSEAHKGFEKNCRETESTQLLPDVPTQFIPPNTLNPRSFTKIMKRLAELHPEVSRDHIVEALQEVRLRHQGFLNGLSINTIVEMTSSVLKNPASGQE